MPRKQIIAVPVEAPPMKVMSGMDISSMQRQSIFDGPSGPEAKRSLISLRSDPFAPQKVVAQPVLGQDPVEKILQREIPPEGISQAEASAMAEALRPALESAAKALDEKVACGQVDAVVYQEVKAIMTSLEQFAAAKNGGRADLSAAEIQKIEAVLACQATYDQISGVKTQRTIAMVAGGALLAAIVIWAIS